MSSSSVPVVQPGRIQFLKQAADSKPSGPVVYWMLRDQRLKDNWALIHAVHQANHRQVPIAVAFNLSPEFEGTTARHLGFMLRGLKELHADLHSTLGIPFFLFRGEAVDTIPNFLKECGASLLVTDFSPLREVRQWKAEICKRVNDSVSIHEVDAHNVVPVWVASVEREYSASTIKEKIGEKLLEYLIDFPELSTPNRKWTSSTSTIDWDNLIEGVVRQGAEIPEVQWCEPGERAAIQVLTYDKSTTLQARLKYYSSHMDDPSMPQVLSDLSPYLHFGQICAQRCALDAQKVRELCPDAVTFFLEELIVQRGLADNFCFYEPHYDSLEGAWDWARNTLMEHASDKRKHLYTREQLEKAETKDPLWNASQLEMVCHGKLHSSLRLYWAKKILAWTSGPKEALETAIYLNNKYHIDGRDPNGYVVCMRSICGVHEQGWKERLVYGKIRYMGFEEVTKKFNLEGYISYVKKIVGETKKMKAESNKTKDVPRKKNKPKELRLEHLLHD